MRNATRASAIMAVLIAVAHAQAVLIQFGGDATITLNANYQSQIGATQVIQWNGVNSAGGSFGASGSLTGPMGAGIGATLTSLGSENLVLTTRGIASTGNAMTFSGGSPNILGVGGGDTAKFDSSLGESWSFDFNQDVVLKYLVFSALGFNGETIQLTFEGGSPASFNRTDALMAAVTYGPTAERYVYSLAGGGAALAAGQDVTLRATQGQWGL